MGHLVCGRYRIVNFNMDKNVCLILFVGLLVLSCFFVSGITMTNGEPGTTVVVPTSTTDSPGGGGGGGGATVNATANETDVVNETVTGGDEVVDEGVVSKGIDKVTEFVKGFGWGTVLIVLAVLAVIGGTAWYVLKDKRKKFVEVRVKK